MSNNTVENTNTQNTQSTQNTPDTMDKNKIIQYLSKYSINFNLIADKVAAAVCEIRNTHKSNMNTALRVQKNNYIAPT